MRTAVIATAAVLSVGTLAGAAGAAGYLSHREPANAVQAQADLAGTLGNIPTSAPAPPIGSGPAEPAAAPPPQAPPAAAPSPKAAVVSQKPAATQSSQGESTAGQFMRFLREHRRPPLVDRFSRRGW
jgi:hypothetical protein